MTPTVARIIAGNALRYGFRCAGTATQLFPLRTAATRKKAGALAAQRGHFGSDSMWCEIEIFEVIHDLMSAVGAKPDMWKLRVNDRILLESLLIDIVGIPRTS